MTRATRVRAQSNEKIKPSEQWDRRIAYVRALELMIPACSGCSACRVNPAYFTRGTLPKKLLRLTWGENAVYGAHGGPGAHA
jgi:hypothetical protein